MNEPERIRAAQKARNLERQAEVTGKREDWKAAAEAWKKHGNTDRYEECKLAMEMCK